MPKQLLTSGETIEYPEPTPEVAAFLARAHAAAADPGVSVDGMVGLIYGPENPILDKLVNPNRPMVTTAVFENPVYRVLSDLIGVKQLQLGHATTAQWDAMYTVTVADAAKTLGITPAAVRAALSGHRLAGRVINGQWYTSPTAVASFRVSTRGRRKAATVEKEVAADVEHSDPVPVPEVEVTAGSEPGASLTVRGRCLLLTKKGNLSVGGLHAGWDRAYVKTTIDKSLRAFVIEPAPGANEVIAARGLSVRGPFRIVRRANNPKAANEVWKEAARV